METLDFVVKALKEIGEFIADFVANIMKFAGGFKKKFHYEVEGSEEYQPKADAV